MKQWQAMAGIFIVGFCVSAQDAASIQPVRESEEETVSRCVRDLDSADVMVRRRAAMLLGKYSGSRVETALIQCLKDSDAEIRLGALVSLTEEKMLPETAASDVFRLLSDQDVHVRRLASSTMLMAWSLSARVRMVRVNGNSVVRTPAANLDAQKAAVLAALDDTDASVRKNILTLCRLRAIPVPAEKLQRFLTDPAADVRMLAIQLCRTVPVTPTLMEILEKLTADPAPEVRQELCELCGSLDGYGVNLLQKLLKDSDKRVCIQAALWLVRLKAPDSGTLVATMVEDGDIPVAQRIELVRMVAVFQPEHGKKIYRKLLKSPSDAMVAAALQAFCPTGFSDEPPAFFIPYLDSDSGEVARIALVGIRLRLKNLTQQDTEAIMAGRNKAAKNMILTTGLRYMDMSQSGQILMDACMDSEADIRMTALRMLPRYRPDGWDELLAASLEDEDEGIRNTAADVCFSQQANHAIRAALQNYLKTYENPAIKARIRQMNTPSAIRKPQTGLP